MFKLKLFTLLLAILLFQNIFSINAVYKNDTQWNKLLEELFQRQRHSYQIYSDKIISEDNKSIIRNIVASNVVRSKYSNGPYNHKAKSMGADSFSKLNITIQTDTVDNILSSNSKSKISKRSLPIQDLNGPRITGWDFDISTPIRVVNNGKVLNLSESIMFIKENKDNLLDVIDLPPTIRTLRRLFTFPKPPRGSSFSERKAFKQNLYESLRRAPLFGALLYKTVDPFYQKIKSKLPSISDRIMFQEEKHCFVGLGCLETTMDFYHPEFRPINVPPKSPAEIATSYTLYTSTKPFGTSLARSSIRKIKQSTFNPRNPTKFIIHGWSDEPSTAWVKNMTEAFLFHGDYNVFVVDWSRVSHDHYFQSIANARVIALEMAFFISVLHLEEGLDFSSVHLVGYSLGAHIAGYVGGSVKGIGRITGIDPGRPYFQHMPATVRLDPSDAQFVDVIHTDTVVNHTDTLEFVGFGLIEPVGHIDFYPNGGRLQPDCNPIIPTDDGILACSHQVGHKMFTESLKGECSFLSFPCESYELYKQGRCFSCASADGCASMGIDAINWQPNGRENVKMFLSTSRDPHICRHHYRITVKLADQKNMKSFEEGHLEVSLISQEGNVINFHLSSDSATIRRRDGSRKSFLVEHHQDLTDSKDALVSWTYRPNVVDGKMNCGSHCSTDLEVATVTFTPLDTQRAIEHIQRYGVKLKKTMCADTGPAGIKISSGQTVRVSSINDCSAL